MCDSDELVPLHVLEVCKGSGGFCPMIPPFIYSSIDGIQFFRSANDVILSPGNEDGIILPQYFQKITESK